MATTVWPVEFWVYENWRAHGHRATVHRGDCAHCNHGSGQHGGTRSDNGRWLGPFTTVANVEASAGRTGAEVRRCRTCSP